MTHSKGTNDSVLNSFKYFDENEGIFLGTISVGTRTGRPSNEIDLKKVNPEARFDTRLEAFYLLSNYWINWNDPNYYDETKRSITPLRIIFEYQEEHIFDIPQKVIEIASGNTRPGRKIRDNAKSININVSDLDSGNKKYQESFNKNKKKFKIRMKVKKSSRKSSSNIADYEIVKGLSSILSELESQDASGSNNNLSSNGCYIDDFSSALNLSSKKGKTHKRKTTMSKNRSKNANTTKIAAEEVKFLGSTKKISRRKKTRPSSISIGTLSLLNIVKSLDEISTEMESARTNN